MANAEQKTTLRGIQIGYGAVAKLFHWLTLIAILVMISVGMRMVVGRADRMS